MVDWDEVEFRIMSYIIWKVVQHTRYTYFGVPSKNLSGARVKLCAMIYHPLVISGVYDLANLLQVTRNEGSKHIMISRDFIHVSHHRYES